ncbi:hypothetical protein E2C01_100019 [Portunus trituberculatus]|uniref:Uncharacterized protein n=1 Tax=Portunus trituberculatus TaxID=210409 RepID=A0A5B7KGC3_PORTR|nr:hypothetical protein [Portunus trituberculatus]
MDSAPASPHLCQDGSSLPPVDIHQASDVNCGGEELFLHYFTCAVLFILIGRLLRGRCFCRSDGRAQAVVGG